MATTRPFAFNTGSTISGTQQLGQLAIGVATVDYSSNYGGVKWWMGPDEDSRYFIAHPMSANTQPTQIIGVTASVGFWGTNIGSKTESAYLGIVNNVFNTNYVDGITATIFLTGSGYWTNYVCTPSNISAPVISGTNRIGSTLSATTGSWSGTPSGYTYQWTRNNINISSATGVTYTLVEADAAASIRCIVIGANGCGSSSATSNVIIEGSFVSTWNTTLTGTGSSNTVQVTIPLESAGSYTGTIYWGDGTSSGLTYANRTKTYSSGGTYQIVITATRCVGFRFNNTGDISKILSVIQWGPLEVGNNSGYFYGCRNLTLSAVTDTLTLSGTTNFSSFFRNCLALTTIKNLNNWNVSGMTNMSFSFQGTTNFKDTISGWTTSNVTDMSYMFNAASSFNDDIGNWDVSKVTNFTSMFQNATNFNNNSLNTIGNWTINSISGVSFNLMFAASKLNQPIGNWNTSKVTDMGSMFQSNTVFNQNIGSWVVTGVTTFTQMFQSASAFNNGDSPSISGWTVTTGSSFNSMFQNATSFNQPLGGWTFKNTGTITMTSMFFGASNFNKDIGSWNVSRVTSFQQMFQSASAFNNGGSPSISGWTLNTSASITTLGMFSNCTSFNQPIGNWDTSKITTMNSMFFNATTFNQNIGSWIVTGVTDMGGMFQGASVFNNGGSPSISGWTPSSCTSFSSMFNGASVFNQPIGSWTLKNSGTINMLTMFIFANAFDQNIGTWNVRYVNNFSNFMQSKTSAQFTTTNLDFIYSGWSANGVTSGLTISFGGAKYTSAGVAGKAILTGATYGWTIVDGGQI